MRIGIAADHAGFALKEHVVVFLQGGGHDIRDFGAERLDSTDDYPELVIPLAKSVAERKIDRGIAMCGSGIGASIAANKIAGVRAAVCHDVYSARQGVQHDDMNILCLGGRIIGPDLATRLVDAFLSARFLPEQRYVRRLKMIRALENHVSPAPAHNRTLHGDKNDRDAKEIQTA